MYIHTLDDVILTLVDCEGVGLVVNWWKDVTEHIFAATRVEVRMKNNQFSLSLHSSLTIIRKSKFQH